MKRFALTVSLAACLVFALGAVAMAFPDSVFVESKSVVAGTVVNVGIFMSNSVPITALVMPLKIVAGTPAANIDSVRINTPAGTRYSGKLNAVELYLGYLALDADPYPAGCGSGFKTTSWEDTVGNHDPFLTHATPAGVPVGILISRLSFGASLAAGADDPAKPSFTLDIRTAAGVGTFEIDTSCQDPANYLSYVDDNAGPVFPVFTKGVITVLPTAVEYLGGDGVPRAYSLEQNYPNPFNASTVIKFNTKHDGNVRLDVFNVLGQRVRTLVDEFRHLGPQAVDWDATDVSGRPVSSGMYFYRIVADDFTAVKKMVLLK